MSRLRFPLRRLVTAAIVFTLSAAPVAAQGGEDAWGPLLTEQMAVEYDCAVAFFSQVAERELNGDVVVLAKVHCQDKRTFDAYRPGSFELFEIHPCENPENRVC